MTKRTSPLPAIDRRSLVCGLGTATIAGVPAARWIPTADESMVIIRFAKPRGIDFSYLHSMIHDSFMSRANSIVIPGAKLDLAMQLILTPFVLQLVERHRRAG
jgi:phosphoribulokinase